MSALGCASSPSAGGSDGGAPGQGGIPGSSGANLGGGGLHEAGGSQAAGGVAGNGGNGGTGGATVTNEQAGSGGSSGGGAGGDGGAVSGGNAGSGGVGGGGAVTGSCNPARPHAPGTSTISLQSGGTNRSYLLHIPPGYDGTKPLPLVFDVHGYTSFASEQLMRSKWDKMADKEGFVLIDPDGVNKSWNAGSCCGGNKQDDVKFFRDMVAKATAELCIDSKRVYVSGHSNGGAMTYRLACEAADIFAAVAPVCGWMTVNDCSPVRPIPVLAIRGLNDTTVTINTADGDIEEWLSNDKCAEDKTTSSGVCKTYTSCAAGTQVMDCRPRGNHNFFYATNPDNYLVPDNAWPFFKQFSLP
ncbi:MAG TPA: PHB depolymerase family esterase [Polyangiaceae bacterium]|nr:PHB depolymerase family esterase [Polyangiaceae bacterium]